MALVGRGIGADMRADVRFVDPILKGASQDTLKARALARNHQQASLIMLGGADHSPHEGRTGLCQSHIVKVNLRGDGNATAAGLFIH